MFHVRLKILLSYIQKISVIKSNLSMSWINKRSQTQENNLSQRANGFGLFLPIFNIDFYKSAI